MNYYDKYQKYKTKYKKYMAGSNIIKLSENNQKKLLKYQIPHANKLLEILRDNKTALDASDTGTGKTYVASAICSQLDLNPIIICPKTIISSWKKILKVFNIKPFMIINYETARLGKYYDEKNRRRLNKYITVKKVEGFKRFKYVWNVPKNVIFIFDEAHKCKNYGTMNSELLVSAFNTNNKLMMLSATISDTPEKFSLFGYILKFSESLIGELYEKQSLEGIRDWIMRSPNPVMAIHSMLYSKNNQRASRLSISDLGDLFPETQISAIPYNMGKMQTRLIEKEYLNISIELDKLTDKKFKDKYNNRLTIMLRARQRIELLKSATIIELAKDFMDDNYSVCIFVNFVQTIKVIEKEMNKMKIKYSIIIGGQSLNEREQNIELFQANTHKIIICNIKAGGIGISLHDIHGGHPRVSLISPAWDATSLVQTLGRIHRAKAKTKSLQRIVYCANTVEEKIADILSVKLNNLSTINDGDTTPSFFKKN